MAMKIHNGVDLNGQRATNAADATGNADLVTLQQVNGLIRGLSWKDEVRAASTANVTLATPGTTLDGVTLAANDRVLLKNQTAPAENGIYVWTASGSPLTRALDADSSTELNSATVSVMQGTANADTLWVQTADNPTVGTTAITWVAVGAGTGFSTAGAGLTSTGSTVDVVGGTGIIANPNDVAVDTSVVGRKGAASIGTTASTAVPHGAGSADVVVTVRNIGTGAVEYPDITIDTTNITVVFPSAPGAGTYRVVWHF